MLKLTLIMVLLWLPSLIMGIDNWFNYFAWRHQLILLTGFLGLSYMCFAALLAARLQWLEKLIKGLDKGYALHKRLGIAAVVSLSIHWLMVKSAHWLIAAEVIAAPNRHKPALEGVNWHGIAEQVGDISFKLFVIFSIISLVQTISYKRFRFTHKIAGILVIAGVFHAAFLLDWNIQSVAINVTMTVIAIVGVACSCLSLSGKIGKRKKATGRVTSVNYFIGDTDKSRAVRFAVQLETGIGYQEGQFAYLDFHDGEAPHPFSILNYDPQSNVIEFAVKGLGDYTDQLVVNLKTNQKVTIEGGYGCFQISDFEHQVWVGAGIGVVPFLSRLYWLKDKADKQQLKVQKIHFFYCVNSPKEAFFSNEISAILAHLDFIELHLVDAQKGELLDSQHILQRLGSQKFDLSFCGPAAFGKQLQAGLQLPEQQFNQEIFSMR